MPLLNQRAFELACFALTGVVFMTSLVFFFNSAGATGTAWLLSSCILAVFSMAVRSERLDTKIEPLYRSDALRAVNCGLLGFVVWAAVEFVLAMNDEAGLGMRSQWMTVIGALAGAHACYILARIMKRLVDTEERQERSLLNPIGEIA